MGKSIKLKNETYIDSTGVVHSKKLLSDILNTPQSCCCYLKSGSITAGTAEIRNYATTINDSDSFIINTNSITINDGISRIKISANLNIQFSTSGNAYITIKIIINGETYIRNYSYSSSMPQYYYHSCSIPTMEIDVSPGDVIEMEVYSSLNGNVHNDQYGKSYITIEKVC